MAADALAPYVIQDISSHDIDYVEYVGPYLTWGRILSTVRPVKFTSTAILSVFQSSQGALKYTGLSTI